MSALRQARSCPPETNNEPDAENDAAEEDEHPKERPEEQPRTAPGASHLSILSSGPPPTRIGCPATGSSRRVRPEQTAKGRTGRRRRSTSAASRSRPPPVPARRRDGGTSPTPRCAYPRRRRTTRSARGPAR